MITSIYGQCCSSLNCQELYCGGGIGGGGGGGGDGDGGVGGGGGGGGDLDTCLRISFVTYNKTQQEEEA